MWVSHLQNMVSVQIQYTFETNNNVSYQTLPSLHAEWGIAIVRLEVYTTRN